jgi:hypothetical protein
MGCFSRRIRLLPGRHVTDRQMRLYMKLRRTEPVPIAAAKPGLQRQADAKSGRCQIWRQETCAPIAA